MRSSFLDVSMAPHPRLECASGAPRARLDGCLRVVLHAKTMPDPAVGMLATGAMAPVPQSPGHPVFTAAPGRTYAGRDSD
ncbi:hypothetical protein ACFFIO_15845 [Citricoccus parietis]|uniref:Uncharacterized protein n=1 Tax=Citricoccus parietis TaxID=592307 RepID=A0ABV6F988_9MICC